MLSSSPIPHWFVAAVALSCLATPAASAAHRVTIAAADVDRAGQVVTFRVPPAAKAARALRSDAGLVLPLQIDADGTAWCVIPAQKAGQVLTFVLTEQPVAGGAVQVQKTARTLDITVNDAPALAYQMDKEALPRPDIKPEYKRAGYLHPVFTPSGTIVTDDYPVQHIHHHGIWSPWTETRFQGRTVDFWNMGKGLGTVEFEAVDRTWGGVVHGGFVARHRFVDLKAPDGPLTVLHETWEVRVYNVPASVSAPAVRLFDLSIRQTCATRDPLVLPKYHYGGLGYRGRGEWYGRDKANFLSSDGTTDRVAANHERMRWVHISGAVENGVAGTAILGHPDNVRAPQPVRVHTTEPYVSFTPSQLGDWQIEPGKPYVARYRFVVADGAPERPRLEAFWNGYTQPAVVRVDETR